MHKEVTNATTMHTYWDESDASGDIEDIDHEKSARLRTRMAKNKTNTENNDE